MGRPKAKPIIVCLAAFLLALGQAGAMAADKSIAEADKLVLKRNYSKAAAVLERAAKEGNPAAQYRLASLYRLGVGTGADQVRAKFWLKKAASAGNKKAAQLLRRLNEPEAPATKAVSPPRLKREAITTPPIEVGARDAAGNSWVLRAAARGQIDPIGQYIGQDDLTGRDAAAGETPLMLSIRMARISSAAELLKLGASVKATDSKGRSALLLAAAYGDPPLLEALIDAGADTSHQDKAGATALVHALKQCKPDNAEVLLRHRIPMTANKKGESPLHLAVQYCGRRELFEKILAMQDIDAADSKGRTALWYAAARGDSAAIQLLAGRQSQSDIADVDTMTPLHAAAQRGQAAAIEALIAAGADPGIATDAGNSPLLLSAAARCAACIAALAAQESDIDRQNKFGDTALIVATRTLDTESVKLLINAGADHLLRNAKRETAAGIAERLGKQDVIRLLTSK